MRPLPPRGRGRFLCRGGKGCTPDEIQNDIKSEGTKYNYCHPDFTCNAAVITFFTSSRNQLKAEARGARRAVFQPMREEAQPTSHGTAHHHSPRAELRQEATARADGPWSRHSPTAPRTQVRRSEATHPAGACFACVWHTISPWLVGCASSHMG